mgnify:CR=1 FL=1
MLNIGWDENCVSLPVWPCVKQAETQKPIFHGQEGSGSLTLAPMHVMDLCP